MPAQQTYRPQFLQARKIGFVVERETPGEELADQRGEEQAVYDKFEQP